MIAKFIVDGYGVGGATALLELTGYDPRDVAFLHITVVDRASGRVLASSTLRLQSDRLRVHVHTGEGAHIGIGDAGLFAYVPTTADTGITVATADPSNEQETFFEGIHWRGTQLMNGGPAEPLPTDFYNHFTTATDFQIATATNVYDSFAPQEAESSLVTDAESEMRSGIEESMSPRWMNRLTLVGLRGFATSQIVEFAIPTGTTGSGLTSCFHDGGWTVVA